MTNSDTKQVFSMVEIKRLYVDDPYREMESAEEWRLVNDFCNVYRTLTGKEAVVIGEMRYGKN